LLSMVPLFAVALALFTAFPLFADFRAELENFILRVLPGQISSTVLQYVNEFAQQATRLTAVGVIFLGVTAVSMIVTVDHVLNDIWRVRDRRPLTQRILIYWAIITLGPILIGASLTATSFLWSRTGDAVEQLPGLVRLLLDYAPFLISGFAYAALYVFVPNRSVRWRDALIGGFVAAVLAEILRIGFGIFVARGTVRNVYGAFAALPLFLFWLYLSWYVLLFGAAIAAAIPKVRASRFTDELRAGNEFITAVALIKALLEAKNAGNGALPTGELASRVRVSPDDAESLLESLQVLNYVRRLATTVYGRRGEQDWILTCDPDAMNLRPAFERFAVDPENTLLRVKSVGLQEATKRWLQADWLTAPLTTSLADG
jgi:membrane protein